MEKRAIMKNTDRRWQQSAMRVVLLFCLAAVCLSAVCVHPVRADVATFAIQGASDPIELDNGLITLRVI